MPPRRRKCRYARMEGDAVESTESDSLSTEDTDHQRTMNIITRLSQKYLQTKIHSEHTSDTTTTSDTDQEYYGDEENSTETTGQSDASMSSPRLYDRYKFNDTNNEEESVPRLVLSPIRSKANIKKTVHQKVSHKKNVQQRGKVTKVKNCSKVSTGNEDVVEAGKRRQRSGEKTMMVTCPPPVEVLQVTPSTQRVLRKRKSTADSESPLAGSVSAESVSEFVSLSGSKKTSHSTSRTDHVDQSSMRDSGVFVSPPICKRARLGGAKDTSTPSSVTRSTPVMQRDGIDSCFGFDTLESPPPNVSPVRRVGTPMSDYYSMSSTMQTSADTFSERTSGFPFSMETEEKPTGVMGQTGKFYTSMTNKTKGHKNKKVKNAKVQEKAEKWAEKMNAEFEELENFELSIEG